MELLSSSFVSPVTSISGSYCSTNLSRVSASLICLQCVSHPGVRLSSVCPFWLLIGPFVGRQEHSCNYPAIVATIRKIPFCTTNTFTLHALISFFFFIILSVTFLCNGIQWVDLMPDGHQDALLTQWRACSREANLVSAIQPRKTGAQPAALFSTRLCKRAARWSGKPRLQVGFLGFSVQLEQLEQPVKLSEQFQMGFAFLQNYYINKFKKAVIKAPHYPSCRWQPLIYFGVFRWVCFSRIDLEWSYWHSRHWLKGRLLHHHDHLHPSGDSYLYGAMLQLKAPFHKKKQYPFQERPPELSPKFLLDILFSLLNMHTRFVNRIHLIQRAFTISGAKQRVCP